MDNQKRSEFYDCRKSYKISDFSNRLSQNEMGCPVKLCIYNYQDFSKPRVAWILFGNFEFLSIYEFCSDLSDTSKLFLVINKDIDQNEICKRADYYLIDDLIKANKLEIICGLDLNECVSTLCKKINTSSIDSWRPIFDRNILIEQKESVTYFYRKFGEKFNLIFVAKNTKVKLTENIFKNFLVNLPLYLSNPEAPKLDAEFDFRPVVIVGAGPSLRKQLSRLLKYKDFFTIISVSAAYPILKDYGIEPDYIVTLDMTNTPVWTKSTSSKIIIDIACDPKTVWSTPDQTVLSTYFPTILNYLDSLGYVIPFYRTGGSVATSAFSFAKSLGTRTIILIGQDLAYSGHNKRTEGYAFDTNVQIDKSERSVCSIKGYGGVGMVQTDLSLMSFKTWYEDEIRDDPSITVINSTEGGADIEGASPVAFKDVCEEVEKYPLNKNEFSLSPRKNIHETLMLSIDFINNLISDLVEFKFFCEEVMNDIKSMKSGETDVDFYRLDHSNMRLKNYCNFVKEFCESYGLNNYRDIGRMVSDHKDLSLDEILDYYIKIYDTMFGSSLLAIDFSERVRGSFISISTDLEDVNDYGCLISKISEFSIFGSFHE